MRYSFYTDKHLTIRGLLLAACIELNKSTNFLPIHSNTTNVSEMTANIERLSSFDDLFILPMCFEYEPSVATMFRRKNRELMKLNRNLEMLNTVYMSVQSINNKDKLLFEMKKELNRLIISAFNLFDEKEEVLNKILWMYYPDERLKSLEMTYAEHGSSTVTGMNAKAA